MKNHQIVKIEKDSTAKMEEKSLNYDCLCLVFDFLSGEDLITIEEVSKQWKAVSLAAWKRKKYIKFSEELRSSKGISVEERKDDWSPSFFQMLFRCAPYVKVLDFENFASIPFYLRASGFAGGFGGTSARFDSPPPPPEPPESRKLFEKTLTALSRLYTNGRLMNPTAIHFPTRNRMSSTAMSHLGDFVKLEKLTLMNMHGLNEGPHGFPDMGDMKNFSTLLTTLTELKYLKTDISCPPVSLIGLSINCEQIIIYKGGYQGYTRRSNSPTLTQALFTADRSALNKLVLVDCVLKDDADETCLSQIIASAPNLTHLDLSGTVVGDHTPISLLRKLRELYLNNCYHGDGGQTDLSKFIKDATFVQNVTVLQMIQYPCKEPIFCSLHALSAFVNLHSLALSGHSEVEKVLIYDIIGACEKLEELYLRRCDNIGAEAFTYIGRYGIAIRILDVSHCPLINDECILGFIQAREECDGGGASESVTLYATETMVSPYTFAAMPRPYWLTLSSKRRLLYDIYTEQIQLHISYYDDDDEARYSTDDEEVSIT